MSHCRTKIGRDNVINVEKEALWKRKQMTECFALLSSKYRDQRFEVQLETLLLCWTIVRLLTAAMLLSTRNITT